MKVVPTTGTTSAGRNTEVRLNTLSIILPSLTVLHRHVSEAVGTSSFNTKIANSMKVNSLRQLNPETSLHNENKGHKTLSQSEIQQIHIQRTFLSNSHPSPASKETHMTTNIMQATISLSSTPQPRSLSSKITSIEHLIKRRRLDGFHSRFPSIPINDLVWDYAPFSALFERLRKALNNTTAYPLPMALRTAIHASLLEMDDEAQRLNKDIELNQWRVYFDPRKAIAQEELVFQRTLRRDLWLDDLRRFEEEYMRFYVRNPGA
ncbi:hypothetical protein OEA41_006152 [Lepraria neglecta]|uniref:Uncharacterized protein n=1 Tax=Lepraria neglecta TaxID=209136 RepID=A0AAE0DJZ3_9LECA|nr:hypothetical protein OEA41_006152 [Lepraria neglecta]